MSNKLKLGLSLLMLGTFGVLSMLTVHIPLDNLPKTVTDRFTAQQIQLLTLINPLFLVIISILIGTALHDKVNLKVPSIKALLKTELPEISFMEQLKSGLLAGLLAGVLITIIAAAFQSILPAEFIALGSKIEITTIARLLYGGLTEELLLRFGFMTLVVWIVFKISSRLQSVTYVIGIFISSLLFAAGHLPLVYNAVAHPSVLLLVYIMIGNTTAGIIFGWLYWKKGLEAAMIAHMAAHVVMMIGENMLNLQ